MTAISSADESDMRCHTHCQVALIILNSNGIDVFVTIIIVELINVSLNHSMQDVLQHLLM